MITFLISLAVLFVGYFIWSQVVDKVFGSDDRKTPAVANPDGVDRVPMKTWKAFLILCNLLQTFRQHCRER